MSHASGYHADTEKQKEKVDADRDAEKTADGKRPRERITHGNFLTAEHDAARFDSAFYHSTLPAAIAALNAKPP
jgi:hypothetical protein